MKRVYFDANLLLAYALGPEEHNDHYAKAEEIFLKVKRGEFLGVISTLTLTEILGVFRLVKGRELETLRPKSDDGRIEYVLREANQMYQGLLGVLLQMPNIKFEKGRQTSLQSSLEEVLEILNNIKGGIKIHTYCKKCGSDHPLSEHKAVATVDILHAIIARDSGCDSLMTFDKGFKELRNFQNFDKLEIVVL